MAGNSRSQGESVASKLARILEAFTAEHPRLRATEVGRRSGLPSSTVHRLLAELAGSGVLRRGSDGTYTVGIRLWELAASHPQLRSLRTAALPAMSVLYATVGAGVHLNVLVGGEGLCVEEIGRPGHHDGARFPLHATAGGHVLLAYAEMRSLRGLLDGRPPPDEPLPSDRALHRMMHIRRVGVAVIAAVDHLAVAAPVFESTGWLIASLEAVAPLSVDRDRLVEAVRRAAADASGSPSSGNGRLIPAQRRDCGRPATASRD